jgi:hypothetical protein
MTQRTKIHTALALLLLAVVLAGVFLHKRHSADSKRRRIRALLLTQKITEHLRTGDVILRKSNGIWSDLFRKISQRDQRFSHVGMILAPNGGPVSVIHAEGNDYTAMGAVYEQSLEDFLHEGDGAAIYRLNDELQSALPDEGTLAALMRQYLGRPFDFKLDLTTPDRLYCTEFVYLVHQQYSPPISLTTYTHDNTPYIPVDSCNAPELFHEVLSLEYTPLKE